MHRLFEKIWEKKLIFLVILLLLGVFLFLLWPRSLISLLEIRRNEVKSVTLHKIYLQGDGVVEYVLSEEEIETLFDLMETVYLYRKLFPQSYTNGGGLDYQLEIVYETPHENVPVLGSLFTEELLSVDGTQYHFYGNAFQEYILTLVS